MVDEHTLGLSREEMKTYGYRVVDIIADHFDTQHKKNPVSNASRDEMDSLFMEEVPEDGREANEILDFVAKNVLSEIKIASHPRFYSFVPGPSNFISAMADALASGFNIFSGGWVVSAAAAELEIVSIHWLLKLFRFPVKKGGGIFTSGGSMANLTALVTARRQKCGDDFSKAVIYMSDQTHSSNIKAIRTIGFKKGQVRIIPTDMEFKIYINKLKNAIAKDKLEGLKPFCIVANAGTTNTGSVDPLLEMSKICKDENIWMHVDAAYGGAAILSDEGARTLRGIEKADSLTIDPHKWFYQPYEIGCLLVKNHKWLSATFSERPEYLRDIEGNPSEINFYDHGIELSRGFRALKFYMSIKTFGLSAFRKAVTYNIDLARQVEERIRKSKNWEVISPATLAIINFRYNPIHRKFSEKELNEINQKISQRVTASKKALLVTTVLNEQVVLRMCLINPRTTLKDIDDSFDLCNCCADRILNDQPLITGQE